MSIGKKSETASLVRVRNDRSAIGTEAIHSVIALLSFAFVSILSTVANAQGFPAVDQSRQEAVVRSSITVLNEIMAIPLSGIPTSMLADAQGVAIIPNVIRGGFVVGARHGRGVLLVREQSGLWHAPVFITLTGGNIGWQAGVQSTDVVLVFRSRRSVDGIMAGKFTIGADAAAAAGPVGRQASAATDRTLNAEILSYSRSRGLFAGVALDGSMIQVDGLATSTFYPRIGPNQEVVVPESAQQLTALVASLANNAGIVATPELMRPPVAPELATKNAENQQRHLAQAALSMYELLDDQWRAHLAMPAEIFNHTGHPTAQALQPVVDRFNAVATNPQFQSLAVRPEFQSTHALLKQYFASLTETPSPLQLPPPPQ
ncbi:MAG TPA: Ysc84 actin-binding domain protein [Planctomycetaceae bacterium]|nr:Ysc84 actin-binding domain protein [Planctomycetaceae bacterium]